MMKKGFTLIEIIVVMIILGLSAMIMVPQFIVYINQAAAQAAENNMLTIYNAEKNFFLSHGYYCTDSLQNPNCGTNLTNINTNLNLNIADNNFNYVCTDPLGAGSSFICKAINASDVNFQIRLTNSPLYLQGSGGGLACTYNPNCTYGLHENYCPAPPLIPC